MDVDIDLPTTFDPLKLFKEAIRASQVQKGQLKPHNVGVYFQNIPQDKITKLAAIPYDKAGDYGFFKIDFLHLSLLDSLKNKEELRQLMKKDPDWEMLTDPDIVPQLFQLHKHLSLLQQIKPHDVDTLADTIALIRPSKKHLIPLYINCIRRNCNKLSDIRSILYSKPVDDQPYFKRPHAIAYALTIILQLHILKKDK